MYILQNETYKGDKLLQKTHPKDLITKRPDPRVAFESNYLENDHKAIVGKDVWDAVQRKISRNKELEAVVGHRGGQASRISFTGRFSVEAAVPRWSGGR